MIKSGIVHGIPNFTVGRWDDLQATPATGDKKAQLTTEAFRDTPWELGCFRHDQDNTLHFAYQMSHKWDEITAVSPHLHLVPLADPAGADENAIFKGQYTWWAIDDGPIPANASWTALSTATLVVPAGGVYKHRLLELGDISGPANPGRSSMLLMYIYRHGTDGADTYDTNKDHGTAAANLGLLSADLHYMSRSMGGTTEYG